MGAYSFLSRRIGASKAQRLIEGEVIYTAQELYEMGVVDHLAEEGQGSNSSLEIYL